MGGKLVSGGWKILMVWVVVVVSDYLYFCHLLFKRAMWTGLITTLALTHTDHGGGGGAAAHSQTLPPSTHSRECGRFLINLPGLMSLTLIRVCVC